MKLKKDQKYIIRCDRAGVFYGEITDHREATGHADLVNVRRGHGWVIDENNNRASIERWGSLDAAKESLGTLVNCSNCINCYSCSNCSHCSGCSGCSGCSCCSYCSGCFGCSGKQDEDESLVAENTSGKVCEAASKTEALVHLAEAGE